MKELSLDEIKDLKRQMCKRVASIAAKRFCVLRMVRLRRLMKRIEALDSVKVSLS